MVAATRGYADPLGQIMMQDTCKEQRVRYSGACCAQLSQTATFLRHVSKIQSDLSHSAGDLPSEQSLATPGCSRLEMKARRLVADASGWHHAQATLLCITV